VSLLILVILLIAALRSHFVDMKHTLQDDLDSSQRPCPQCSQDRCRSGQQQRGAEDIDASLDKLIEARDRCNLLRKDGHVETIIGRAASTRLPLSL
jgi:hypothetical protein